MIPIVFEQTETEFASNGLFRLTDCVSCKVTEVRNGIYELEFKYPVTGRHYADIQENQIVYAIHDDSKTPQPFDIYRRNAPLNGIVTFYAHHISYRQSKIVVEPFAASSAALALVELKSKSINTNPFTYSTELLTNGSVKFTVPQTAKQMLGGIEGSILDAFGGEYEWDKFTVYLRERRGRETSIELRYGKNITDIKYDVDDSESVEAVVPYWTNADRTELAMLTGKIVYKYEFLDHDPRTIMLDLSGNFKSKPSQAQLQAKAEEFLLHSDEPKKNIDVKFFELWNTEEYEKYASLQRAYLGDTVSVIYTDLGINASMRVVKTVYNVLDERYDSMELGKPKASFSKTLMDAVTGEIYRNTPSINMMQDAIDHATRLITGGYGGHFVIGTNADGEPNEVFFMDTDNVETAVNVLRINYQGIGFSTVGVEGPYLTAWTIDGHFVADFITSGTLLATLIKAGVLSSVNSYTSIDMETGEFYVGDNNNYIRFYISGQETEEFGGEGEGNAEVVTHDVYSFEARLDSLSIGGNAVNPAAIASGIEDASKVATNYIYYSSNDGLVVSETGTASGSAENPYNTQITSTGINLRNRSVTMARFTGSDMTYYISGLARMVLNATALVFNKPDGVTQAASIGASGLDVKTGIIGGFTADETSLSSTYQITDSHSRSVAINKPRANHTKLIEITETYINPSTGDVSSQYKYNIDSEGNAVFRGLEAGDPQKDSGALDYIDINYNATVPPTGSSSFRLGSMATDSIDTRFKNTGISSSGEQALLEVPYSDPFSQYRILRRSSSSSKRYKDHVSDMSIDYARQVLDITPILFKYKDGYLAKGDECEDTEIPGLYAEDVEEHYKMGVYHNSDGSVENWKPDRLIPAMIRIMQEQQREINEMKENIEKMRKVG